MATLTIRGIPESVRKSLRLRAARHGRSMEEEVRQMIRGALVRERAAEGLGTRIADRFAGVGGVELSEIRRSASRSLSETDDLE